MNDNPLSAILDDPEAMKKIAEIAGEFAGGGASPGRSPSPGPTPAFSANPSASGSASDPATQLMQHAVPLLTSIARSGQQAADPDRLRLLTALKPFVSSGTAAQLDHAARLLSVAHMARTAAVQVLASDSSAKEV